MTDAGHVSERTLRDLAGGASTAPRAREAREHLLGCRACRQRLADANAAAFEAARRPFEAARAEGLAARLDAVEAGLEGLAPTCAPHLERLRGDARAWRAEDEAHALDCPLCGALLESRLAAGGAVAPHRSRVAALVARVAGGCTARPPYPAWRALELVSARSELDYARFEAHLERGCPACDAALQRLGRPGALDPEVQAALEAQERRCVAAPPYEVLAVNRLLAGEGAEDDASAFDLHLDRCEACRRLVARAEEPRLEPWLAEGLRGITLDLEARPAKAAKTRKKAAATKGGDPVDLGARYRLLPLPEGRWGIARRDAGAPSPWGATFHVVARGKEDEARLGPFRCDADGVTTLARADVKAILRHVGAGASLDVEVSP